MAIGAEDLLRLFLERVDMQTYTTSQMRRFLAAMDSLLGAGTPLIDLLQGSVPSTPDPAMADFTLADFTTYAALPFTTPTAIYTRPDGTAEEDFGDLIWALAADPAVSNTITGYLVSMLVSAVRTPVYYEAISPQPMMKAGDAVVLSVPFQFFMPGAATLIS